MKRILIIILCFTNLIAFSQSILVNNQSVNVSSDISFPYWLDSTSTLAIDSYVVSISVLEFNITPTTNGNSLVFNQAKSVTTQETVPSGKTWKVESVLLDPSFTQSNNSNVTTVVSGGGGSLRPVALSNESSSTMSLGDAALYCDSLVEDGYDNWVLPNLKEMLFIAGGGGIIPGIRSNHLLKTITFQTQGNDEYHSLRLNNFSVSAYTNYSNYNYVRCVRHAAVTVSSGGGSSSEGSNSTSGGGGGNMPVALSEESAIIMTMGEALIHCDSLQEGDYDNWVVPTWEELMFVAGGGGILPGTRTSNFLITSSRSHGNTLNYSRIRLSNGSIVTQPGHSKYPIRCVRHEFISVSSSGGGSSSGGSTPSTLGNGMPTMISNESSSVMVYGNCVLYCDSLSENGHSDWIMPTIDQLTYASSGGCVIPDTRSSDYIWSRSFQSDDDAIIYKLIPPTLDNGYDQVANRRTDNPSNFGSTSYQPKCRCVR